MTGITQQVRNDGYGPASMIGKGVEFARRAHRRWGWAAEGGTITLDGPYDGVTSNLVAGVDPEGGWVCNYTLSQPDLTLRICLGSQAELNALQSCNCGLPTYLPPYPTYLGAACSQSGANVVSDYAPWGGDREERVEITVASTAPAGSTVIAIATTGGTGFDKQVYDEQGNTWTLDAQKQHAGDEKHVMIWRSVLTTAIAAGDYIRFANRSNTLNVGIDTYARCVGAYMFTDALSVASVGTGASGFTANPSLNTPAGAVVVAAIGLEEDDAVTGLTMDSDWTDMIAFTLTHGGSPANTIGVGAQYLVDASASTWQAVIDQTRVWAAISVGYSR